MFEKHSEPLAPVPVFVKRMVYSIIIGWLMIIFALAIGMVGYRFTEGMPWMDAFVNAAMILATMGPMSHLYTEGGKLFAGLYALFCGLNFIIILSVIFGPIAHRFFHKFHLD